MRLPSMKINVGRNKVGQILAYNTTLWWQVSYTTWRLVAPPTTPRPSPRGVDGR